MDICKGDHPTTTNCSTMGVGVTFKFTGEEKEGSTNVGGLDRVVRHPGWEGLARVSLVMHAGDR